MTVDEKIAARERAVRQQEREYRKLEAEAVRLHAQEARRMQKLRAAAAAAALLVTTTVSEAGVSCTRMGAFTNCTNTDTGETYTGSRMGNFENWRQTSPGYRNQNPNWMQNRQTCSWVGNTYICN